MVSFDQRYTARPDPSVRNDPVEPAWVVITVPVVLAALAGLPLAGVPAACDPPPLLHAAASSAAATGTPSLTGIGIRVSNELLIFILFLSGGDDLGQAAPQQLLTDVTTAAAPIRLGRTGVRCIT
jgi:hypothetical protein